MRVTWDPRKAAANVLKHGIRFSDAEAVLFDPAALTREDTSAEGEQRFVSVGLDALGRVDVVAYTYRAEDIRMISARAAVSRERRQYEERIRLQQGEAGPRDSATRKDADHDLPGQSRARRVSGTSGRRRTRLPDDDQ